MLVGEVAALREIRPEDGSVLHAAFRADPAAHAQVSETPWVPRTAAAAQARLEQEGAATDATAAAAADVRFAVQSATDSAGRCQGYAMVWGIDLHNRTAHLAVGLVPASRGRGLGLDVVRLLCRYAFEVRDLHRVALETLATNEPMRRTALAAGFTAEGVLRENGWVMGERVDEVLFGLLRPEWAAQR